MGDAMCEKYCGKKSWWLDEGIAGEARGEAMLKTIRVVLDPPRTHNGEENPDPTDYLDFEVNFTSHFQYQFFYDLVKDRLVMIDRWELGE